MIITRFAPSPTGALHLGGARTALFNFLFARHHQDGKFLLRIEDTDKERSSPEAEITILKGLEWLGLRWDGEPVYQSQQNKRHQEIAAELLKNGSAYYCDCSAEKLASQREQALTEKRSLRYDRCCRDAGHGSGAVRIKMPLDGIITIDDQVQGEITTQNSQLDDFIIVRSNGQPTYMLCVVVDDFDMGITHIIRGNDHLTNAARQGAIYKAMGWNMPVFAHIPLIHDAKGSKLSKRRGAVDINKYKERGFLPEAMRNYLARLGWSHGNDEIFSDEKAIEWFSLGAIGKSPARFDEVKLDSVNKHYLGKLGGEALLRKFVEHYNVKKIEEYHRFMRVFELIAERSKTLTEFAENARFIIATEAGVLSEQDKILILDVIPQLKQIDWKHETIKIAITKFGDDNGGLKPIAQALRRAVIGQKNAPSIFEVIVALGKNETMKRLEKAL